MRLVRRNASVNKVWLKLVAFPALCLLLLCAESLFSQANTGRITGVATDVTGAVVPNVKVTIIAVETNRRQTFVTDNTGHYSSGPLPAGAYRVEAQATGFVLEGAGRVGDGDHVVDSLRDANARLGETPPRGAFAFAYVRP